MPDFEGSTLWRISEYERMREDKSGSAALHGDGPSLLPTTLLSDLRQLQADPASNDVLEVMAACLRNREAALLCIEYGGLVWPLTLFPRHLLCHSPCDASQLSTAAGLSTLKLISAEPPTVRPPGDAQHERVAAVERYRPLGPLLWRVALEGPRRTLLKEIGGHAAYRLAPGLGEKRPAPPGALGPAVLRLREGAASLRDIAHWPGLSVERASRLLNALYLTDALMVTRTHPMARGEPLQWRGLLNRRR
jgi:hypothetical protein